MNEPTNTNQTSNQTSSDVKKEPKVTMEKAVAAVQPKVEAVLKEALAGFELDAGDRKSRKRIFAAVVQVAAQHMFKEEGLSHSALGRRCSKAINYLVRQANPPKPSLTLVEQDESFEEEEAVEEEE